MGPGRGGVAGRVGLGGVGWLAGWGRLGVGLLGRLVGWYGPVAVNVYTA